MFGRRRVPEGGEIFLPTPGESPKPPVERRPRQEAPMQSEWQSLRGSETILFVEDEDSLRDVVVNFLSDLGYRVLAATNGPEAIHLAGNYPGVINLLVSDLVLPRITRPHSP